MLRRFFRAVGKLFRFFQLRYYIRYLLETLTMAEFVIQSRFAGLKIEDDSPPSEQQQKAKKSAPNSAKKSEQVKKTKSQPNKTQTAANKKKKQTTVSSKQWEQWKQKDEQLVDGNFEDELQQAILLSTIDFEEKKDVYKKIKKDSEKDKKAEEQASKIKNKKLKKKNVMSLDQFNDMMNGDEAKANEEDASGDEDSKSPVKVDTKFFERVKDNSKHELRKDQNKDIVQNRLAASDEVLSRVQFIDALERKDKEIAALRQELTNMKQELYTVKSRNKKLCNILGQGEMKDKAEVLFEVERLRGVQSELTSELASLHTDLEKARSMNSDPRAKDKKNGAKKKNIRFDVSSEAILAKESSLGTAG